MQIKDTLIISLERETPCCLAAELREQRQMVGTVKGFRFTRMLTYPIKKKPCRYLNATIQADEQGKQAENVSKISSLNILHYSRHTFL